MKLYALRATSNPIAMQGLMAVSAIFFFSDALWDINEHISESIRYSPLEMVHLILEILASVALALSVVDNNKRIKKLKLENNYQSTTLHYLKKDFEALMHSKFEAWGLTQAERDTVMLMLKGLTNDDIANVRDVTVGTVKAQSHSAFKKAGLKSRHELLAVFIDEFVDIGLNKT